MAGWVRADSKPCLEGHHPHQLVCDQTCGAVQRFGRCTASLVRCCVCSQVWPCPESVSPQPPAQPSLGRRILGAWRVGA